MIQWWSAAECVDSTGTHLFGSIDQVFALDGDLVAKDSLSCVLRVGIEGKVYYVKRYQGNGKSLTRRWFGLRQWLIRPRVRKEWENLLAFQHWGIPTAKLVAFGLERCFGGFRRGALVTEEIVGSIDLARLAATNDPRLGNFHWVDDVSRQVARITRIMHDAGFAHNDLKWRNVLVVDGSVPRVFLIDCPSGCYWGGMFLRYRMIKDIACLDKVAKYHLSRTQRLRFYLEYSRKQRLSDEDKRRIRKIVGFFAGRE